MSLGLEQQHMVAAPTPSSKNQYLRQTYGYLQKILHARCMSGYFVQVQSFDSWLINHLETHCKMGQIEFSVLQNAFLKHSFC